MKSGLPTVGTGVFAPAHYDILPDQFQVVDQPDIMIIEGLNVLQTWDDEPEHKPRVFVSDF